MESGNIKPINYSSVHKICSGQVVLTLATAVKELVENSIDSGANIIEVKLREYGSEQIEVIDNGKGVKSSDFQNITLKHHTSKISDFADVASVSTFGFRGEALSSLCSLSNVEITTCHCDSTVGTLLVYDHDGLLIKKSSTHRQVGTTVTLKNLFFTLPVRHKEFHRNLRREYAKMLQVLTAYCLITTHKRITCTNTTDKGRKSVVLATNSCDSFKDNISCIFGSKQVNNLMEFVQYSPSESILEEYFVPQSDAGKCNVFRIEGYVSTSSHGEGRSSSDRQFFFINGRPCDLPKLSKVINEIYHSFNKAQYPFVFLNINLAEGSVDVNVTPDKRQIFIPYEKMLLCVVKTSLHQMYQLQPSEMKISENLIFKSSKPDVISSTEVPFSSKLKGLEEFSLKRKVNSSFSLKQNSPPSKSSRKGDSNMDEKKIVVVSSNELEMNFQDSPDSGCLSSEGMLSNTPPGVGTVSEISDFTKLKTSSISKVNFILTLPFNEEKAFRNVSLDKSSGWNLKETLQRAYRGKSSSVTSGMPKGQSKCNMQKSAPKDKIENFFYKNSFRKINNCEADEDVAPLSTSCKIEDIALHLDCSSLKSEPENASDSEAAEVLIDDVHQRRKKKIKTISFSMDRIRKDFKTKKKTGSDGSSYRKFRSRIAPGENNSAETELKKEIKKENFLQMDIIGQFNLGFILTRLNDDLFIIDQHATDEKYNFEVLQKQTVLETQRLLNPQNMTLTAVSEALLLDNLHVFEKSGFRFNIDEDRSVGRKVELVSVPVSHNWRFGKEDVDEMIFMLTDNPVCMIRPSRINQMFASRACRKSVMIGTALTLSMMRKLVVHMGEIEQPWNCPHGRPTIRHLFNLNLLRTI